MAYVQNGLAGSIGAAGLVTDEVPVVEHIPMDWWSIVAGKPHVLGMSVSDLGSILLICATLTVTLITAYYELSEWRYRRKKRRVREELRRRKHERQRLPEQSAVPVERQRVEYLYGPAKKKKGGYSFLKGVIITLTVLVLYASFTVASGDKYGFGEIIGPARLFLGAMTGVI